jgi:hypothetical protein
MSRNKYERWQMKHLRLEMAKRQLEIQKPPADIQGRTHKIQWTRNFIVSALQKEDMKHQQLDNQQSGQCFIIVFLVFCFTLIVFLIGLIPYSKRI